MTSLGFDPVWFGVIIVLTAEIGILTPPLGLNVYVVKAVSKEPLSLVFRGIYPYLVTDGLILVLLCAFPQLALYLPGTMGVSPFLEEGIYKGWKSGETRRSIIGEKKKNVSHRDHRDRRARIQKYIQKDFESMNLCVPRGLCEIYIDYGCAALCSLWFVFGIADLKWRRI